MSEIVKLDGPRLPAKSGKADSLVVLVHGYGADGQDLIGLAPHWQGLLPNTAFVAPNGPQRCDMQPMGYQWFPITRLDPSATLAGVKRAAPSLDAFLADELQSLGLGPDRLALVGFSQGTMMSLHVGPRQAVAPAGIVGYSGMLTGAEELGATQGRPPVLLVHGDADEVIPVPALHNATQALGQAGFPVQWHISRGVGHGIDPEGLSLGGAFLRQALNPGSGPR